MDTMDMLSMSKEQRELYDLRENISRYSDTLVELGRLRSLLSDAQENGTVDEDTYNMAAAYVQDLAKRSVGGFMRMTALESHSDQRTRDAGIRIALEWIMDEKLKVSKKLESESRSFFEKAMLLISGTPDNADKLIERANKLKLKVSEAKNKRVASHITRDQYISHMLSYKEKLDPADAVVTLDVAKYFIADWKKTTEALVMAMIGVAEACLTGMDEAHSKNEIFIKTINEVSVKRCGAATVDRREFSKGSGTGFSTTIELVGNMRICENFFPPNKVGDKFCGFERWISESEKHHTEVSEVRILDQNAATKLCDMVIAIATAIADIDDCSATINDLSKRLDKMWHVTNANYEKCHANKNHTRDEIGLAWVAHSMVELAGYELVKMPTTLMKYSITACRAYLRWVEVSLKNYE